LGLLLESPFHQLTAVLFAAALAGYLGLFLRQPVIVSFIAVGVLAGPDVLGLVQANGHTGLLAQLGIALLLFLVGLKLDLELIRSMGSIALLLGVLQVGLTALAGFALAHLLGFDALASLYLAFAMTFSSTIIVVKLLTDRHEAESLHGRMALGVLIVQDLVVVLAMLALASLDWDPSALQARDLGFAVLEGLVLGALLIASLVYFIRRGAEPLLRRLAGAPELLVVFALAWAACFAALGMTLGLSKELGGLLAGVTLASTPFRDALVARLAPVRDFLLLFFFVDLGTDLDPSAMGVALVPAAVFCVLVLLGKPLIVTLLLGLLGFRRRTSFLTGVSLAQISEFSLILVAQGRELGHIDASVAGVVTLVAIVTIAISVYAINDSPALYRACEPALRRFERRVPYREESLARRRRRQRDVEVIVFGLGRYGRAIAAGLQHAGVCVLVVDFNPEAVVQARRMGVDAVYGDAADPAFVGALPLARTTWVVCTLSGQARGLTHQDDPRFLLLDALARHDYRGLVAVATYQPQEAPALTAAGADRVLLPFHDAAQQAVDWLMPEHAPGHAPAQGHTALGPE